MNKPTDAPATDVIALGELEAHLSEAIRAIGTRNRPLVITDDGQPAAVLLSLGQYDRMADKAAFLLAIHEGLADAAAGRVVGDHEVGALLDARFGPLADGK